ncbi:MAG: tetratricopeptide repeat protein [Pseudomonadota bacterium]
MITLPRLLFAGAIMIAIAGYLSIGSPGLADQPMSKRAAELEARNPSDLTPAEMLARLERLTQTRPDDPEAHYFIGQFLMSRGREPDAVRAFQSALRRDPSYVPALIGLGDAFVRLSGGQVGPEAQQLYAEAYSRDPSQVRAGFQVGSAFWQMGDEAQARAAWEAVSSRIPPDSNSKAVFDDWVANAVAAGAAPPESRSSNSGQ